MPLASRVRTLTVGDVAALSSGRDAGMGAQPGCGDGGDPRRGAPGCAPTTPRAGRRPGSVRQLNCYSLLESVKFLLAGSGRSWLRFRRPSRPDPFAAGAPQGKAGEGGEAPLGKGGPCEAGRGPAQPAHLIRFRAPTPATSTVTGSRPGSPGPEVPGPELPARAALCTRRQGIRRGGGRGTRMWGLGYSHSESDGAEATRPSRM